MAIYWINDMRHYHLDVIITEDELKVIKDEFKDFIEAADGFTFRIIPDNGDAQPSPELTEAIKGMFFDLLIAIQAGKFKGVN